MIFQEAIVLDLELKNGTYNLRQNQWWYPQTLFLGDASYFTDLKTKINNHLLTPKKVDIDKTVYTSKLCNIPRHKLKVFLDGSDLKRTSKIEHSEIIILDKNHLLDAKNRLEYIIKYPRQEYIVSLNLSNDHIKNLIKKSLSNIREPEILENAINNNKIFFRINDFRMGIKYSKDIESYILEEGFKEYHNLNRSVNLLTTFEMIDYIGNHPDKEIIYDEDILEKLNADGINLDEDYINTLENMFKSGEKDNINLALEMLSHVNINNNALTIALLLNRYAPIFNWGSGMNMTSVSSFKSIIKYFKSKDINWKTDWRDFSKQLYSQFPDDESVDTINKFVTLNLETMLNLGSIESKIRINNINLVFTK
jgi:hypothetical protein